MSSHILATVASCVSVTCDFFWSLTLQCFLVLTVKILRGEEGVLTKLQKNTWVILNDSANSELPALISFCSLKSF